VADKDIVEVEVDGSDNGCLLFQPLGRRLRGRWVWDRVGTPYAAMVAARWPAREIPGVVIGLDRGRRVGYVREPLADPEHESLRQYIEQQRGEAIGPQLEESAGVDPPTWEFWMARAVEAGFARVIRGRLRSIGEIRKDKPRVSFFPSRVRDERDRVIDKLVGVIGALVPANRRAEIVELLKEDAS